MKQATGGLANSRGRMMRVVGADVWSGVVGAAIGSAVALVSLLGTARMRHGDQTARLNEIERERSEAAIGLLADVSDLLAPLESPTGEELKALATEWSGLRRGLMVMRQVYPVPVVRHDILELMRAVDQFVLASKSPAAGRAIEKSRDIAQRDAELLGIHLREDRPRVAENFMASAGDDRRRRFRLFHR